MEPNLTDAPADSSPADNDTDSTPGEADLLAEMKAFVGDSGDAKPSASKAKPKRKDAVENEPAETASDEAAAKDDAGPAEEGKNEKPQPDEGKPVPFETFKKRVDKLSAQRHAEAERADKAEMQVQRLLKAVEILQAETARFAPHAKVDPRDEQIRAHELEKQVERFNQELEKSWADRRTKAAEQLQVEERAQAIVSEAKAAAAQYGVDAKQILQVLQVSGDSPENIARLLAAAAAPAQQPKPSKPAPKAVASSGKTAGNDYLVDGYPTSQTMADFLRSLDG